MRLAGLAGRLVRTILIYSRMRSPCVNSPFAFYFIAKQIIIRYVLIVTEWYISLANWLNLWNYRAIVICKRQATLRGSPGDRSAAFHEKEKLDRRHMVERNRTV